VQVLDEQQSSSIPNGMAWLTWVYVLSIIGSGLAWTTDSQPSNRPVLAIRSATIHVNENRANELANTISFELSKPLEYRLEVPLTVTDGSARQGEHYAVRRRPRVIFEAGATQGTLSGDGDGCDVVITDDLELQDGEPRSFDITLGAVEGIVDLDNNRATCRVSIDDDEKPPTARIKVQFASSGGDLRESQVAGHSLAVKAESPAEEKAEMTVSVQRSSGKQPTELGSKVLHLETGQTGLTFQLSDVVSLDRLQAAGLSDDDMPGPPSELVVHLRGQHPLYAVDPRDLVFNVTDDDPAAKLAMLIEDAEGRPVDRILPATPFWVVANVDRGIRLGTPLRVSLDKASPVVTGTLTAGERSVRLGPLNASQGSERLIDITMEVPANAAARPFVEPAFLTKRLPKGPKDPGRFAVIVVNTSRLREPANGIFEAVWTYMDKASSPAFGKGMLLVGPNRPKILTNASSLPEGEGFNPLAKEGEGVAAQLKRLLEVVSYVRQESQDPSIRIVVIWPERGLELSGVAARLNPVDRKKFGPISFLFPDMDFGAGIAIRDAFVGGDGVDAGALTVRCPDVEELSEHIRWAIDGFRLPGKSK
jgi:hypothetical protein